MSFLRSVLTLIAVGSAMGFAPASVMTPRSNLAVAIRTGRIQPCHLGLQMVDAEDMKKQLQEARTQSQGSLKKYIEESRASNKRLELLVMCNEAKRGVDSPEGSELRTKIITLIEELESENTIKEPLKSPLINGNWNLRWTTSTSILGLNRWKWRRPVANQPIIQMIDAVNLKAANYEPRKLLWFNYQNSVEADLEPLSGSNTNVLFRKFHIGKLFSIKAPKRARGVLDTTYLDENIRISRGDKGNIFVLTKME